MLERRWHSKNKRRPQNNRTPYEGCLGRPGGAPPFLAFQERFDQQPVGLGLIALDLVFLGPLPLGRVFDQVRRALARQRLAVAARVRSFELVPIVEVLRAQRKAESPPAQRRLQAMLGDALVASSERQTTR